MFCFVLFVLYIFKKPAVKLKSKSQIEITHRWQDLDRANLESTIRLINFFILFQKHAQQKQHLD